MKKGARCYLWRSNGGCAMCDGLNDTIFDYYPSRPHPQCSCDILPVNCNVGDVPPDDDPEVVNPIYRPGDYNYDVRHVGNDDDPPNVTLNFDYDIQCLNATGDTYSGTIPITMTRDELAEVAIEQVASDVYDAVEQIADSLCAPPDDDDVIIT